MPPDPVYGPRTRRPPEPRGLVPVAVATLIGAWLAPACGGDGASVDVAVRDSAGVTIVEHPSGAVEAAPRWGVAPEPELDVGTLDGEPAYQFSRIVDAVTLSNGTVVMAHDDPPELRFYDADGTHLRTAGGEGEGPGEFQATGWLTRLPGDTLLVHDWRLNRVSRFGPDGEFLDSERVETQLGGQVVGRLSDGSLVARASTFFGGEGPPEDGTDRREIAFLRFGADGALRDTVAVRPGRAYYVATRGEGFRVTSIPFSTAPHAAVGPDVVYSAHGGAWEIRVLGPDGGVRRIVRLDRERRPLTGADWSEAVEGRTGDVDDPSARKQQERMYGKMPRPDRHPALDAMEVDASGRLWVREAGGDDTSGGDDQEDRWLVFSPEGRLRAVARTPSRFRPLEIGRERMVGRWVDELSVHHLRVYELDRQAGDAAD